MVTLHSKTAAYYQALNHAISSARSRVTLSYHAFCHGKAGNMLISTLVGRAASGCRVVLTVDTLGQITETFPRFFPNFRLLNKLTRQGVEVTLHHPHPDPRRLHHKMVLIDDHTLAVGGSNIADHYTRWQDLNLIITKPFPLTLHDTLISLTPGEFSLSHNLSFIQSHHRQRTHLNALLRLIDTSTRKLYLCTWYCHPPQEVMAALKRARHRGVDITLVFSHHNRVPATNLVNRSVLNRLRHLNIHVYRYTPTYFHPKCYFNDQCHVLIGSPNLDWYSSYFSSESSLYIVDRQLSRKLSRLVLSWQKQSSPFP